MESVKGWSNAPELPDDMTVMVAQGISMKNHEGTHRRQMGAVDRATIEAGIPGIVLMENAAHRWWNSSRRSSRRSARSASWCVCGKGNNGGDGLAVARQLYTRFHPRELRVVLTCRPVRICRATRR